MPSPGLDMGRVMRRSLDACAETLRQVNKTVNYSAFTLPGKGQGDASGIRRLRGYEDQGLVPHVIPLQRFGPCPRKGPKRLQGP